MVFETHPHAQNAQRERVTGTWYCCVLRNRAFLWLLHNPVHSFAGQACHNVAAFTALACKLRQQIASSVRRGFCTIVLHVNQQ